LVYTNIPIAWIVCRYKFAHSSQKKFGHNFAEIKTQRIVHPYQIYFGILTLYTRRLRRSKKDECTEIEERGRDSDVFKREKCNFVSKYLLFFNIEINKKATNI
jgi:hypothetical protein